MTISAGDLVKVHGDYAVHIVGKVDGVSLWLMCGRNRHAEHVLRMTGHPEGQCETCIRETRRFATGRAN